ncbi:hypothetical protein PWT90_10059 [Aphanocladium album]|nr:hypothetical protein PWT90_10059 [Aphanocladium album]
MASATTQIASAPGAPDERCYAEDLALSIISAEAPSTIFPTYQERCKDYVRSVWRRVRFRSSRVQRRLAGGIRKACRVKDDPDLAGSRSSSSSSSADSYSSEPEPERLILKRNCRRAVGIRYDAAGQQLAGSADEIAMYTPTLCSCSPQPREHDHVDPEPESPKLEQPKPINPRLLLPAFLQSKPKAPDVEEKKEHPIYVVWL